MACSIPPSFSVIKTENQTFSKTEGTDSRLNNLFSLRSPTIIHNHNTQINLTVINVTTLLPQQSLPISFKDLYQDFSSNHLEEKMMLDKVFDLVPFKKSNNKISKKKGIVSRTIIQTKKFFFIKSPKKVTHGKKTLRRITSYPKTEFNKGQDFLYIATKIERKNQIDRINTEIHFFNHFKEDDIYPFILKKTIRDDKYVLIMEKFGLSLFEHLNSLSFIQRVDIFRQIVELVQHVHQNNFTLGDIKPENILVKKDEEGTFDVRLIDFDFSIDHNEKQRQDNFIKRGTLEFMSPESLFSDKIDFFKVDVWALGVTMYELFNTTEKESLFSDAIDLLHKRNRKQIIWDTHYEAKCLESYKNEIFSPLFTRSNLTHNSYQKLFTRLETILQGMLQIQPSQRWDINKVDQSLDEALIEFAN